MKQSITIPPTQRQPVLERIARYLALLPEGKAWQVEVGPYKRRRSEQQNRYLWGVCYATILKEGGEALAGWDAEDLHEFFLGSVFGWETLKGMGKTRLKPLRRSSILSTTEFSDFVAHIQRFMAERGVYIPDPNEQWEGYQ